MSGSLRSSTTQSQASIAKDLQRFCSRLCSDDLDVVMPQQLADAEPLGGIVFDDEQALPPRTQSSP